MQRSGEWPQGVTSCDCGYLLHPAGTQDEDLRTVQWRENINTHNTALHSLEHTKRQVQAAMSSIKLGLFVHCKFHMQKEACDIYRMC